MMSARSDPVSSGRSAASSAQALPQRGEVFGPGREPATAEFQQRRQRVPDRGHEGLHALGGATQHRARRLVMLAGAAQQ
jgi:hypothetical protein